MLNSVMMRSAFCHGVPLGTHETKVAAHTGKGSILTILRKNSGLIL